MMDPVLGDYARNLPDARESEVLSLFATIINKYVNVHLFLPHFLSVSFCHDFGLLSVFRYKGAMIEDVPHIFEASFQCTLEVRITHFLKHILFFFESQLYSILNMCTCSRDLHQYLDKNSVNY